VSKQPIAAPIVLITAAFVGTSLATPLYALFRRELHFSEITLTLIYSTYAVGNVIALLFFGQLSDRIGRKRTAIAAVITAIVGALVFLFVRGTSWLYWGRFLTGLSVGIASGTGTAWLAELIGGSDRSRATLAATCANFGGIALGPLFAGLVAQYLMWPLKLPFATYTAVLLLVGALVALGRETLTDRGPMTAQTLIIRPRIGVPSQIGRQFIAPAFTAFAIFAFGGFYFALLPTVMMQDLGQRNLAVAGAVVFALSVTAILVIIATRRLESSRAMLLGLGLLLPALGALVLAQTFKSMPVLVVATLLGGAGLGPSYRGSLQVVNEIAPGERRAEVVSSYYIVCFLGNSVPVIGIGVLATFARPLVANITFAAVIASLAIAAFILQSRYSLRAARQA
jgi:MFS family permease